MKISACPKCGSKDIQMGGITQGTLFGITSWNSVCRKCGYKGMPIIFESEKDYVEFLQEISDENKKDSIKQNIKLTKKEKEVVDFLKETEEEIKKDKENKSEKKKNWWKEIWLSSLISFIIVVLNFIVQKKLYDTNYAIVYGIVSYIPLMAFILLWIVVIEYIIQSVKKSS